MRHCVVLIFAVLLLSIAVCFHVDERIMNPASVSEEIKIDIKAGQQRITRQTFRLGESRKYLPVGVHSGAPTVIVVPERGSGTVPGYGTGDSPYTLNRGTTVVVSQAPEYYNNVGRRYDVIPINPIRK